MARYTTFRFCLDPTVEQQAVLSRHAGASRFAFNQCLRMTKTALTQRRRDLDVRVPWTGFDLINAFNVWKKTEAAGRVFAVDPGGQADLISSGLAWRGQVCQQVFEEAAVDCGRALAAWSDSRSGKRRGRRVGFPRFKKKTPETGSFRLRNKHPKGGRPAIRIGDTGASPDTGARSVTLPGIGTVRCHDDTRRLRRMLTAGRAKVLFATITRRAGRWWVALNVQAADLHSAHHHSARADNDDAGWAGVDRGLTAFLVAATADGIETMRVTDPPKALTTGIRRQKRLSKSLSRKQRGSHHRRKAAARLRRHHHRVANTRKHFLHQVSNELVKTHDRIAVEDLNIAGMLRNHHLARTISDAGWAEFARLLHYKQAWRSGDITVVDRWYPSSQLCSACGDRNTTLTLADRVFTCGNGHTTDRDFNAAVNLAQWATEHHQHHQDQQRPPDPQAGGRATNARRRDGSDQHLRAGETSSDDTGTDDQTAPAA